MTYREARRVMPLMPEAPHPQTYRYTVDGQSYETERSMITGALLRARLPEEKRGFGIFLEGIGNAPDRWLNDQDQIALEQGKNPQRFYTSPSAMFG